MTIISLKNVMIGYGKKVIGKDLNIDFQAEQVTCLLGANGCGKTTLLNSILGVLAILAGEITINQKPQTQWTRRELAQFIGYVPQAHNGIFPYTVEEVVLMGRTAHLSWYGAPHKNDIKIAVDCLAILGIEHLRYQNYIQLSGGERQLVLIARALAQQPKFLIMDEPTSSLDFGNQIKVLEHILQLKNEGLSILLTTHQPQHALRVADNIILLNQGSIIAHDVPAKALTASNLATIYGLEKEVIQRNLNFVNQLVVNKD